MSSAWSRSPTTTPSSSAGASPGAEPRASSPPTAACGTGISACDRLFVPVALRSKESAMLHEKIPNLAAFVEPDRVRREVYTDSSIFEMEMERIHERVWIYCGHESQVSRPGDYYTVQIGRQPMVMVRANDGSVNVLYNRCPHRGSMICGDRSGNAGEFFRCSYHSWTFHHDGKLKNI